MWRMILLLLISGISACASNGAHWKAVELTIDGGTEAVVGESCTLNVEIVNADGSSKGVLSYPATAGTTLSTLVNELAAALTSRFDVDTVVEESGDRIAYLYLANDGRFGSVSRSMVPRPAADPRGGSLTIDQAATAD